MHSCQKINNVVNQPRNETENPLEQTTSPFRCASDPENMIHQHEETH